MQMMIRREGAVIIIIITITVVNTAITHLENSGKVIISPSIPPHGDVILFIKPINGNSDPPPGMYSYQEKRVGKNN